MKGIDLKTIRKQLGKTQEEFGKQIGVSKRAVIYWENDDRKIPKSVELYLKNLFVQNKDAHSSPEKLRELEIPKESNVGIIIEGYVKEIIEKTCSSRLLAIENHLHKLLMKNVELENKIENLEHKKKSTG